jgi:hypothetical protein
MAVGAISDYPSRSFDTAFQAYSGHTVLIVDYPE